MIFKVQMKDPDMLYDSIRYAVGGIEVDGLSESELDAVKEARTEAVETLCRKWFRYGEYLTVEIDTEKETCVVVGV
jgi:hypothetical protein